MNSAGQSLMPGGHAAQQVHMGPHLGVAQDGARDGDALALTAAELAALLPHLGVIPVSREVRHSWGQAREEHSTQWGWGAQSGSMHHSAAQVQNSFECDGAPPFLLTHWAGA